MATNNSIVWVCSRIGSLKKNLDRLLPRVTFVQISEDKLSNIETSLNGIHKDQCPQVLIADNAIIPRLMHEGRLPFKFIQVRRSLLFLFDIKSEFVDRYGKC